MRTHSHEGCSGCGVMRFVQGYQIKETDSKAELRQEALKCRVRWTTRKKAWVGECLQEK
jgi:hypothetical protein